MDTLKEAKDFLAKGAMDGVECPCCKQFFKVYRRTITSAMARTLIKFYRGSSGRLAWLHVSKDMDARDVAGDYAKLRYWGLVEEKEPHAGYWRVTLKGRQFVEGDISVPKHALVLNAECLKLDGAKRITINDALGKRFDIKELLAHDD